MLEQETMIPSFTNGDAGITELLEYMHEIEDLKALGSLAEWDQNTAMPEGAGEVRGYQSAALEGVLHERWTNQRLGTLLNKLNAVINRSDYTHADRGLVREAQRNYDRATKLPRKLVEEMARVQASSFEAWRRAREHNDFASFAPWLSRTVALQREVADHIGYAETRYDALLDLFEPGMTTSTLDKLFTPVREVSTTLLRRVEASGVIVYDSCLQGEFSEEKQVALSDDLLRRMGYGVSAHGFRSCFKTWASEQTAYARELIEAALAHVIGDAAEQAYSRGDMLARRRQLMQAWAEFCDRPPAEAVVVPMRKEA